MPRKPIYAAQMDQMYRFSKRSWLAFLKASAAHGGADAADYGAYVCPLVNVTDWSAEDFNDSIREAKSS